MQVTIAERRQQAVNSEKLRRDKHFRFANRFLNRFVDGRLSRTGYLICQLVLEDTALGRPCWVSTAYLARSLRVSEKTVANSMRRQGLIARKIKRRNGLTKQDKSKAPFPDLIRRDFTATAVNQRWVGDITEIPTAAGKLYLATVIDLYSRRLIGAATSLHPNAELAKAAITMAVTVRGGKEAIWREEESERVIFHSDRGSTYTAELFTRACTGFGSANPWDGSARASTTAPPKRSSPP